tara:strand:- start:447 stop:1004 length:558 start_codon:yes stop_codon:yes gene_type:complete
MICKKRKLLYLHPPRNGGKSIEDVIFGKKPYRGSSCHKPIKQYIKEGIDINSYYTFMFCRNPWDRAVSLWSWYGRPPFHKWINRLVSGHNHRTPQIEWIKHKNKIINLDFLGRFENYEEDFNKLCKNLKVDLKLPHHNTIRAQRKIGQFPHEHYSVYYNDVYRELITKAFKEDIKYFGYNFEEKA